VAQKAFQQLKDQLCTAPMLAHPLKGVTYRVCVDAATGDGGDGVAGLGGVLSQIDEHGVERVIAYGSRSLKDFEKNYTPYLLELAACCYFIDHWSVYLTGKKFFLITDHAPIEKMTRLHKKTLNRLQQQMLEYNFVVIYRKGEKNGAPDALSRNPVDSLRVLEPTMDIVGMQKQDHIMGPIIDYLTQQWLPVKKADADRTLKYAPFCSLDDDGILHFHLKRRAHEDTLVVWAPEAVRQEIIHGCHASRFAGHCGEFRTIERIQTRYFWPGMTNDVKNFIKSCSTCQECKRPILSRMRAPLQPLPVPDRPNVRIHTDLFGGHLKGSANGNKWIIVITDAFSKYSLAVPIPTKDAKTVAKAIFDRWLVLFSIPLQILTDQGKEYSNEVMQELSILLGFKHLTTSAFHPQTNSTSESYNRTMIKFLTQALSDKSTLDWEEELPALQFSYNTQVHKSTLQSPFFLTFLHHPRMPFFDSDVPHTRYSDSWSTEAFLRMQQAYRLAKANNEEANKKKADLAAKKDKLREFNVGDPVVVYYDSHVPRRGKKPGNHKFEPQGLRGFNILKRTSTNSYVVSRGPHGRPTRINVDRIALDRARFLGDNFEAKTDDFSPNDTPEPDPIPVKPAPQMKTSGNATSNVTKADSSVLPPKNKTAKTAKPAKLLLSAPERRVTRSMSRAKVAQLSAINAQKDESARRTFFFILQLLHQKMKRQIQILMTTWGLVSSIHPTTTTTLPAHQSRSSIQVRRQPQTIHLPTPEQPNRPASSPTSPPSTKQTNSKCISPLCQTLLQRPIQPLLNWSPSRKTQYQQFEQRARSVKGIILSIHYLTLFQPDRRCSSTSRRCSASRRSCSLLQSRTRPELQAPHTLHRAHR
jgi:transposase InsO family protein